MAITKEFRIYLAPRMKNEELIVLAESLVGRISLAGGGSAGTVSAVLLTTNANVYSGICLDYPCGLGFCAEHSAVAEMLKHRETRIAKVVAVNREKILLPCGRCRELMLLTDSWNQNTEIIVSKSETIKLPSLLPRHWLA